MKSLLVICSLLALPATSALAADSPWTGTWKIDPSKSHFTGQTMTFSKGAGGMLHFSDGSTASYDFAVDGKEYPTWSNRTATWTAAGKDGWDTVVKAEGKVLAKGHRSVSADGKTLSEVWSGTRPDGASLHEEDVFTRVSGTEGLVGTWKSTKVVGNDGPQQFIITSPSPGVLHFDIPDQKVTVEGRTDGSDNPMTGPDMPPGMTISFKALSPTKLAYVIKLNGKPDSIGEETIAADGRSYSDISWNAGKENEKTTTVYVKQ